MKNKNVVSGIDSLCAVGLITNFNYIQSVYAHLKKVLCYAMYFYALSCDSQFKQFWMLCWEIWMKCLMIYDMVYYAMRFEQTHTYICLQKSSKLF